MRKFLVLILLCVPLLSFAEEPSVEILGVTVSKGMTESDIRSLLPMLSCSEPFAWNPNRVSCSVSDGISPGSDGGVLFDNGVVIQATRNWFFPEDAKPFDVAIMLNQIITRLTGEDRAVCAKIEANPELRSGSMINPGRTAFIFPEKVLTIYTQTIHGESALIKESLRLNPVPKDYKVHGDKHQGKEWCGYVN